MFGKRYLATRKKLRSIVGDVRELASRAGAELDDLEEGGGLLEDLRKPFLLVACGEVNAGKSTFLNALFDNELCSVNVLPETERIVRYRYGEKARHEEISEIEEDRYRPLEFLKDFNLVDTPGTNSEARIHKAALAGLFPAADLVFLIFSVADPWESHTWDLLARFPEELEGKVAVVVQQSDLREQRELTVIREHVCSLARQKLGVPPEVFLVSGKLAREAKTRQVPGGGVWEASGYQDLEEFISRRVSDSPDRRQVACRVHHSTRSALARIEDQLARTAAELTRKDVILGELEAGMNRAREAARQDSKDQLGDLRTVLRGAGESSLVLLRRRVALWPSLLSLFRRDESPSMVARAFGEGVEQAAGRTAHQQGRQVWQMCETHWDSVSSRIREEIEVEPPACNGGDVDWTGAQQSFVLRMTRAAGKAVESTRIRSLLQVRFEVRRIVLQRFLVSILLGVTAGGAAGAAGWHTLSWLFLGAALLVTGLGAWQAYRSGGVVVDSYRERMQRSEEGFVEMLEGEYRAGVSSFYRDYGGLYEIVRRVILQSETVVQSRQQELENLVQELQAVQEEL